MADGLRGVVAGCVVGVDDDLVRCAAGEPGRGVRGRRGRAGEGSVEIDAIAGDGDVVGRGRPGRRDGRDGGGTLDEVLRRRRRARVRAGSSRDNQPRDRRPVPGGVVGINADGVGRAATQARKCVARLRRRPGHDRSQVQVVTRHTNVVARPTPRQRDRRLRHERGGETDRRRRQLRIRTGCGAGRDRGLPRAVPSRVKGINGHRVRGTTGKPSQRVSRRRRRGDKIAVDIKTITRNTDIIGRRRPRQTQTGLRRRTNNNTTRQ